MQDAGYEFLSIILPRTPLNKGKYGPGGWFPNVHGRLMGLRDVLAQG